MHSVNNELLNYLNSLFYNWQSFNKKNDEIVACIKDLKQSEDDLKKWSEITITLQHQIPYLIKKFGLWKAQ